MPNKSGITLIELLIVLALIALVATLTQSNFSFFNRMHIANELEQLHSVCRHLQQRALSLNQPQTITFDEQRNSYSFNDQTISLPRGIHFGVLPHAKGPPSGPTQTLTKPITFKKNAITFNPSGIISAGTVYLIDDDNQWLYALSSSVAHMSFLRLYRFDKKWVLIS